MDLGHRLRGPNFPPPSETRRIPVLIVGGKYRFDIRSSGGPQETLQVADFLIQKERSAN